MKKITYLLWSLVVFLVACNKEDETTYTDICYISSVQLGVVKRAVPFKTYDGRDTLLHSSYNAGLFPMTINQRNHTIENRDSLLFGTQLEALLVNISFSGSVVAYRDIDAEETDEWTSYANNDSMNLTKPLHLYVLSEDGNSKRIYTLKVNVHQQEGDSLQWNRVDSVDTFDGMEVMRSTILNGRLNVIGLTAQGEVRRAVRSTLSPRGEWTIAPTNLPATIDVESLRQMDGTLYIGTSDGHLYTSTDAETWTAMDGALAGLRLAAVSNNFLYGLADNGLYRTSRTNPGKWEQEQLDDDAAFLPGMTINSRFYTAQNGSRHLQLIGARKDCADSTAVVWSKIWDEDEDNEESSSMWIYYMPSPDNKHQCPTLQQLCVFTYDGRAVALGGASLEGRGSHKPLDTMLVSNDQGITWKTDGSIHLPVGFKGVDGPLTATVDNNNYIWIIARHEVWRGRLNRLGFARQ